MFEISQRRKVPRGSLKYVLRKRPESREEWDELGQEALADFLSREMTLDFPKTQAPVVSIILVLRNKAHLSFLCLESLRNTTEVPYEVLVVDNNSSDQTREFLNHCTGLEIILNNHNAGFGDACMQAVERSRGRFLLFLNNDTLPQSGAITTAIRNFEDPSVGAVGGKILLANGALQEAGSILWADGSALGYGRFQDPNRPEFEFRRPVDYCSGAFLFTPRKLFQELGGFDPCYSPAYYEDTDYCMKVWQAGLQVIYEPRAVLHHYESASSGGNEGAIRLMAERQKIFVSRWQERLQHQSVFSLQNVLAARTTSQSKGLRILYIDDRIPQGLMGSGFPRSYDILKSLACQGHHVTCVPLRCAYDSLEAEYVDIPREIELFDVRDETGSLYREYVPQADIVWVSRPHNLSRFLDGLVDGHEMPGKLIYDAEAIFTDRERIRLTLSRKIVAPKIIKARLRGELSLPLAADAVVVVSDKDAELIRAEGGTNVHTIGHCLDPRPTVKPFAAKRTFLFVGASHSPNNPNVDSMRHFCRHVWPQVRLRTGAELVIAGFGMDRTLDVTGDGIKLIGGVSDLTPFYEDARVFIVPTRYAAGIPFKAHEASAQGVPLVVSPLIGEQLGWVHDKDLLIGSTDSEFGDFCARLYLDYTLWKRIRTNALIRVVSELDRGTFNTKVAKVLESVVPTSSPAERFACASGV